MKFIPVLLLFCSSNLWAGISTGVGTVRVNDRESKNIVLFMKNNYSRGVAVYVTFGYWCDRASLLEAGDLVTVYVESGKFGFKDSICSMSGPSVETGPIERKTK